MYAFSDFPDTEDDENKVKGRRRDFKRSKPLEAAVEWGAGRGKRRC